MRSHTITFTYRTHDGTATVHADGEVTDVLLDGECWEDVVPAHAWNSLHDAIVSAAGIRNERGYDGLPAGQTGAYPGWGR